MAERPLQIRPMSLADLEPVSQVEGMAFAYQMEHHLSPPADVRLRVEQYMKAALWKDPEGCFVAEDGNGDICGSVFCTTWGGVGWFGHLAVKPEYQGIGVGKSLVSKSLEYLRRRPSRIVGFETGANRPGNVGFYAKMGFELQQLTLFCEKGITPGGSTRPDLSVERWSSLAPEQRQDWLEHLGRIGNCVTPGLDYSKEILAAEGFYLGDTLCYTHSGEPIGCAIVHLLPHIDPTGEPAYLQVMVMKPGSLLPDGLAELLGTVEDFSCSMGKDKVQLAVNACYQPVATAILRNGYRVARVMVRITPPGTADHCLDAKHINLSHWSG